MSRDWQEDMELVERFKHFQTLCNSIHMPLLVHGQTEAPEPVEIALEYWLQQYAAEKERVNIALSAYQGLAENAVTRGEYQSLLDKHTAMAKAYRAEKERADAAEAREQKLREALKVIKERAEYALDADKNDNYGLAVALTTIRQKAHECSLYPKEEEANE